MFRFNEVISGFLCPFGMICPTVDCKLAHCNIRPYHINRHKLLLSKVASNEEEKSFLNMYNTTMMSITDYEKSGIYY